MSNLALPVIAAVAGAVTVIKCRKKVTTNGIAASASITGMVVLVFCVAFILSKF